MSAITASIPHLQTRRVGIFSWSRRIEDADTGRPVTTVVARWASRAVSFELAGTHHEIRPTSFFGSDCVLLQRGRTIARSTRTGFFSGKYEITSGGRAWELVRVGFLSSFRILRGGRVVGSIGRQSWFCGDLELVSSEEIETEVAIFLLWIVHDIHRRAQSQ